jgi:hypothetical protein
MPAARKLHSGSHLYCSRALAHEREALRPAGGRIEQRRVELVNRFDAQEGERLVDLLVEELEDPADARLAGGKQRIHVRAAEQHGPGAERAAALGAAPDGQSETIAGSTKVEPLPGGNLGDGEVVWLIGNRLEQVVTRTRERLGRVASLDPISEDLLIGIAAALEKQLWMLRAQRAGV